MRKVCFFLFLFYVWACVAQSVTPKKSVAPQKKNTPCAVTDSIGPNAIYTSADSLRVVELLKMRTPEEDVLFYARQFKGIPYVAATLEVADPEQLVVNLRQLDCTTLVETTLALTMTKRQNRVNFSDYCRNLMKIRYWNGQMNGYLSRLHYFEWWMRDNQKKGVIEEVRLPEALTADLVINDYYMSTYPHRYPFLKGKPERVDSIARLEKKYNGYSGTYLPAKYTDLPADKLSTIHNGDLIAIVTRKKGLDYSHLGFAVWGKDGKLHLLNASSLHHKVVEEPKTLRQYLREHPTSIGIRLWRLKTDRVGK